MHSRNEQTSKPANVRGGYIFLISVLIIGTISSTVVLSLVVLGLSSLRTGFALQQSAEAFGIATACTEQALLNLRADSSYAGGETVEYPKGECLILLTGGSGNENRTLCVEGEVNNTVRRVEVVIQQILPTTRIFSWQEVDVFSFCNYPS